jgi:hypothetical protein
MLMTANHSGLVYSGEWVMEGHSLGFIINENDTVKVTDTKISSFETSSSSSIMTLDDAIKLQEKYISLGYDKVS